MAKKKVPPKRGLETTKAKSFKKKPSDESTEPVKKLSKRPPPSKKPMPPKKKGKKGVGRGEGGDASGSEGDTMTTAPAVASPVPMPPTPAPVPPTHRRPEKEKRGRRERGGGPPVHTMGSAPGASIGGQLSGMSPAGGTAGAPAGGRGGRPAGRMAPKKMRGFKAARGKRRG